MRVLRLPQRAAQRQRKVPARAASACAYLPSCYLCLQSLAAHLARRQQQQEQGVHASQEARHGGQKKRRWAKQLLGAEDAKEGCDSGEPSHGASRHADTKA